MITVTSSLINHEPFIPTDEHKMSIIHHLQGEVDIFIQCKKSLDSSGERRIEFDCFLLHARTLYDFLTTKKRFKYRDAISRDFVNNQISLHLPCEKERIDQQLAHISYDRLDKKNTKTSISI